MITAAVAYQKIGKDVAKVVYNTMTARGYIDTVVIVDEKTNTEIGAFVDDISLASWDEEEHSRHYDSDEDTATVMAILARFNQDDFSRILSVLTPEEASNLFLYKKE